MKVIKRFKAIMRFQTSKLVDIWFSWLFRYSDTCTFCPPPFHCVVREECYVVRGSEFVVDTLRAQLLLQFWTDPFETLQVF